MSKPKYMKGDCIRSLDDLVLQENIFWNGRIWNRKWFMNLRNGGYMIDAKEIVQALRCCAEGECKDCAMHEDKQRCQENLLDKASEAIERLTAENAKKEAEAAYEKLRGMEDELTAAKDEACRMADELEALKNRPVEVAVQRDEQAIRDAEAKVRAQAETELRKKTDEWRKQTTKTEQEIERVRKEAESLKQQLAAAKAMAETASSDAEKERLTEEVEALRKKLAMSDKDVTAAQLYFYQWQAAFNQLTQAISHIKDEDKAGKLCAALRAQLAAWGKAMEGTA